MSEKAFVKSSPCPRTAVDPARVRGRLATAPFSTVYRAVRHPQKAVAQGFSRIESHAGRQKRRKRAKR